MMPEKRWGKLKDYTNTKYLYITGENATKVIYAQKRKSGKDTTHSGIQLDSNWVSIAILLNPCQNPFGFHLKHSWNPIGF
jgi:hypothetical protein